MPSTFQEKMRRVFASSDGSGWGAFEEDVCVGIAVCAAVLRRFAGGGLISWSIFVLFQRMVEVDFTRIEVR
jgi:hypothetical protein